MENTTIEKFTLNDEVISHLVQLLQLGLLEGTDITDHFRRVMLVSDETGSLYLDPTYQEQFEETLEKMAQFIEEQKTSQGE